MHIQQIKIVRFKSFEEATFEFNPKVNLLTGINNAGKTTALEAIALWYECYSKMIHAAGKAVSGKYKMNDYKLGDTNPRYFPYQDITSVRSPNYEDIFYNLNTDSKQFVLLSASLANEDGRTLEISFSITAAAGQTYCIRNHNYATFDFRTFNDRSFLSDPLSSIQVAYASPVSALLPREEKQLQVKIDFLKQSHSTMAVLRNRLQILQSRQNGDWDRLLDELSAVLTDRQKRIQLEFVSDPKSLYSEVKIRMGGEVPKDISLLGSGTLQIIEILLSLLEDKRDLNIILLDEPDSHLHHEIQQRLLQALNRFSDKSQVFLSSHNEALIRAADPEWVFHLESKPTAHYRPIVRSALPGIKKGLQPSIVAQVVHDLTGSNSLDFVHALEAGKLMLVEGTDDAIRVQKLLSLKINGNTRYAFWAMRGVDSVFSQIGIVKDVFSAIGHPQTLWKKSVLVMDKDDMTDEHRNRITQSFAQEFGIKTLVWPSYNFESTLLSDFDKLAQLLRIFIEQAAVNTSAPEIHDLKSHLQNCAETALQDLTSLYREDSEINSIFNKLAARQQRLSSKDLKIGIKNIFEPERDLKIKLKSYYESCFNLENLHKICRKHHFERILKGVLAEYGIMDFSIETDFDALFQNINTSLWWDAWDGIQTL